MCEGGGLRIKMQIVIINLQHPKNSKRDVPCTVTVSGYRPTNALMSKSLPNGYSGRPEPADWSFALEKQLTSWLFGGFCGRVRDIRQAHPNSGKYASHQTGFVAVRILAVGRAQSCCAGRRTRSWVSIASWQRSETEGSLRVPGNMDRATPLSST